jgi:RNA polymerase primary sigma factor
MARKSNIESELTAKKAVNPNETRARNKSSKSKSSESSGDDFALGLFAKGEPEENRDSKPNKEDHLFDQPAKAAARRSTASPDPIRIYLQRMASVPLLSREREVEIAKRIEEADHEVLAVVLGSQIAIREIIDLGRRLRENRIAVADVTENATGVRSRDTDLDDYDDEPVVKSEEPVDKAAITECLRLIKKIEKLNQKRIEVQGKLSDRSCTERSRKRLTKSYDKANNDLHITTRNLALEQKQVGRIKRKLKTLVARVEKTEEETLSLERRAGLDIKELTKLLREAKKTTRVEKRIAKQLGVEPSELLEMR